MSGGRLYTIRARLGDDVYVGRSMLGIEPVAGDVIEYGGAVRVVGVDEPVDVALELTVTGRRIPVAGGAPLVEAVILAVGMDEGEDAARRAEAARDLEVLRFTRRRP